MNKILSYFTYSHLPNNLQAISKPFCDLARALDNNLVDSAEKTVALRKLLESKDCAVRASLEGQKPAVIYDEADVNLIVRLAHDRYSDVVLEATSLGLSIGPVIDPPAHRYSVEEAADRMAHYNAAIMIMQGKIDEANETPEDKQKRLSASIYAIAGRLNLGPKEG